MRLTFLGTGTSQGVPVIACPCPVCQSDQEHDKRLRTSALVEVDGVTILIDAGPDFRQQMLRAHVKQLDAILLTHEHKDHIGGLDDVRAFNFVNRKPMDIYAEDRVQDALKQEYAYVFAENRYPGVPEMNLFTIDGYPFDINGVKVTPIRCFHYKMPIYGFRIGDLTYITDANFISEEEKEKVVGSKYIVVNALRKQKHISHFTLSEALKLVQELSPRKAFITHVSHQLGFHADIQAELPRNVVLAYDGLVVDI
ncbi:MBL fold metallo-hydrolase [Williamwhitmania taraxaci]|uniref:Phosphoribosyl 1,2-cyclic phosphate phosphodiesterase n=1 Tax=Williamwhitmania taraxaci TaxID=1640674 RepID=A0A1G6IJX5_9BACT|nr:MBL fold metallo-hydrolase [Williamwhitmania taraxaci]SDC06305.1 phosphoribosyl 1,2-cyclic phosphate phosphodiesterase [Williamwhitmania taraxaci]